MTQTQLPRYTYKFTNSFWKVFDNEEYTDVQKCYLRKEAKDICNQLNGKVGS